MYIAFKWLVGLTLSMWIAVCCIDVFVKKNEFITRGGYLIHSLEVRSLKNKTAAMKSNMFSRIPEGESRMAYLHYFLCISCVVVVLRYRPNNTILDITIKLYKMIKRIRSQSLVKLSMLIFTKVRNISATFFERALEISKTCFLNTSNAIANFNLKIFHKPRMNFLLLKKLNQAGAEKKRLAQLLAVALKEYKTIRMRYQLENLSKKRLMKYIENAEKLMKENRSRYVSFQQLYLVTHQENTFLKFRIKKLSEEKAEADRNLLEVINEIYKSKNSELRSYCSQFLVNSRDNLLNSDVFSEVQRFLKKTRSPVVTSSNWQLTKRPVINVNTTGSWLKCSTCTHITEINMDGTLEPIVSQAPKLKGLPGEYVWTVKDKDGLIEKLYEYDCGSDLDNGETIRRIREYSVYHDNDCLLDYANSSTFANETASSKCWDHRSCINFDSSLTTQRFLTGPEAFKKFMQRNKDVLSPSILPAVTHKQ